MDSHQGPEISEEEVQSPLALSNRKGASLAPSSTKLQSKFIYMWVVQKAWGYEHT
jgi:hypothetical protein